MWVRSSAVVVGPHFGTCWGVDDTWVADNFAAAAFAVVVSQEDILVWVLLLWRFCSYYFYMIQGVFILTYDMAYGNRKYKWQVRKNYLVEESAVFKQEQINRFKTARAKRRKSKV